MRKKKYTKFFQKMKKSKKNHFFEKILNFDWIISSLTSDRNEILRRRKDVECAKPSRKIMHSENVCQSFE